jgi:L-ascorbate metabolism protein UlaG (beta-lactamase superfamily)
MINGKVYLKQNALMKPLVNRWYAWSGLISPATAAMYIANSHLKIMRSFVSAPQVHVSALKNPAMRGGPFINYSPNRLPEIKELMERTQREQAPLLEFAKAVESLDKILASEATGYSLEPLYGRVPDVLKGYVELIYDLNNHPSIRFIEGLLYKSPYYRSSSQAIALSIIDKDDRPFVYSTPALEEEGGLHISIPFNDKRLDELFKMKYVPGQVDDIAEMLGIKDKELFSSFFTQEPPQKFSKYEGPGVRVRYLGHACILIESAAVSILTDPLLSYKYESDVERYTFADLPGHIDYALITHNHQDHFMLETLLQLRHKIRNIIVPKNNGGGLADPSLKLILQNTGFNNVIEIDEMESIEVKEGSITGLPFLGEHGDLNIKTKLAHLITLKGNSILCAADSNNIEPRLYEHIHSVIDDVDVIFLGMECDGAPLSWIYGSLLTQPLPRKMDQTRRFDGSNSEKAIKIIDKLNPREVYIYAMGQEPWLTFLTSIQYTGESRPIIESNKLIEHSIGRGIVSERLYGRKEMFFAAK